ncbi:MAG: 23S rRNA (pseudouridine(1915)-N(3))-methyltransferase RlmH [Deltaproteobacteria bacterium]|nr:23S rRNA (pseudouridine(1915)-N(3))-methyltransferase RlmH [Deltaproteobacteria bacterium]
MRKTRILAVGKLRDRGLRELCDDYYRRCRGRLLIEEQELRDLSALARAVPGRAQLVVLDEGGAQLTSRAFSQRLRAWTESAGQKELVFAIGGADGFDAALRQRADTTLSLGMMTLPHQLARVVLAEQLYRAVSILEGSPYHRD